jgi:hypothetical protein
MKLPRLTNKQQEIVELLYVYRFLNRVQIQQLMGHKDKKTINVWLRDLKIKQYITWIYSPNDFALKTKLMVVLFILLKISVNAIESLPEATPSSITVCWWQIVV